MGRGFERKRFIMNLIKELEENLKEEEWLNFWRQNGLYIAFAVFFCLCVVGGYLFWRHHTKVQVMRASESYQKALTYLSKGEKAKATYLFEGLQKDFPQKGYGILARLQLLKIARKSALETYDPQSIQAFKSRYETDMTWARTNYQRDFAGLMTWSMAFTQLNFKKNLLDLDAAVTHYNSPENPWRTLALESQALSLAKKGDIQEAAKVYSALFQTRSSGEDRARWSFEAIGLGVSLPSFLSVD
jgi:hypothetical protein